MKKTLKILDRHLKSALSKVDKEPEKYTYLIEVLKQVRKAILLENKLQNIDKLN